MGTLAPKKLPRHVPAQGKIHHVIEIDGNILCLDKQIAGPWKYHLVGRGTVTWKAHLISDDPEKDCKLFCVKASWAQMERTHEGYFIKNLLDAGVENVVKLLAFSPEKAGEGNNTQLGSKELKPLNCIRKYQYRLQNQKSTLSSDNELSEHCRHSRYQPNASKCKTRRSGIQTYCHCLGGASMCESSFRPFFRVLVEQTFISNVIIVA